MTCVVYGCSNGIGNGDSLVNYYYFPKHPVIAQQWLNACGWQSEPIDVNTARICSLHFDSDSYITEFNGENYVTCVLKFDAIPSLYLPTTTQIIVSKQDSQELSDSDMKKIVASQVVYTVPNLQENSLIDGTQKNYIVLQTSEASDNCNIKLDIEKYSRIQTHTQLSNLLHDTKCKKDEITYMKEMIPQLKSIIETKNKNLKELENLLSEKRSLINGMKRFTLSVQEQKNLLSKVFSESQIKILSGKKKIYWTNDDMAIGYTIRHLSNKRCYMYLTKHLHIPLPAVSSIKRWMTTKKVIAKKQNTKRKKDIQQRTSESD